MGELGISSDAARQAISRATRSGALEAPPVARRGEVLLTDAGREAMDLALEERPFMLPASAWDGKWSIIILRGKPSVNMPHRVRNQLLLDGLGGLGNGTWITPHGDRSERLVALLDADPALSLVAGQVVFDHPSNREIAEQAWDLDGLRDEYEQFRKEIAALKGGTDEECFASWIFVLRRWQHVSRLDPGIPEDAVGNEWPARGIRELVVECEARFSARAADFFDRIVTDLVK